MGLFILTHSNKIIFSRKILTKQRILKDLKELTRLALNKARPFPINFK
ncbi:hypothetical protein BHO_0900018 (plasmid) [Borrelia hermsii YBT]|nr:hypothetical protein BHO_0900018 [Borrelia hermsii YBT]